jgi:peroxiredoxin-like protein
MAPKTTHRTFQFHNTVAWKSDRHGIMSASQHPSLEVGSPPEFKGTPDVWCPEDLLIGALNTCLMLTFLALARRENLEVMAYESTAHGTVDNSSGKFRVTRVIVQPRVTLKDEAAAAVGRNVIKETKEACMVTNSILATVDLVPEFVAHSVSV